MWVSKKNEETARAIINLLAEKEYTVGEAKGILRYIGLTIANAATVQKVNEPLFNSPGMVEKEIPCLKYILDKDTVIKFEGAELARVIRMI